MGMRPRLILELTENLPELTEDQVLIMGEWFDGTFTIAIAEGWLEEISILDVAEWVDKFDYYKPKVLLDYA